MWILTIFLRVGWDLSRKHMLGLVFVSAVGLIVGLLLMPSLLVLAVEFYNSLDNHC